MIDARSGVTWEACSASGRTWQERPTHAVNDPDGASHKLTLKTKPHCGSSVVHRRLLWILWNLSQKGSVGDLPDPNLAALAAYGDELTIIAGGYGVEGCVRAREDADLLSIGRIVQPRLTVDAACDDLIGKPHELDASYFLGKAPNRLLALA